MAPTIAFGVLSLASPRSPHHQRLPSISRKNEGSSFASPRRFSYKEYVRSMMTDTNLCIGIALLMCVLLLLSLADSGNSGTATALGKRSWKDLEKRQVQSLEQLLMKKEDEISSLELALRRQMATRARVESNMHAQEGLIQAYQQRYETEKAEKLRAIHSLSIMAQNMNDCLDTNHKAKEEVSRCQEGLQEMHSARAR